MERCSFCGNPTENHVATMDGHLCASCSARFPLESVRDLGSMSCREIRWLSTPPPPQEKRAAKRCQQCYDWIESWRKVCPVCSAKQRSLVPNWWIATLVAVCIAFGAYLVADLSNPLAFHLIISGAAGDLASQEEQLEKELEQGIDQQAADSSSSEEAASPAEEKEKESDPTDGMTAGQKNAYRSAQQYLDLGTGFSRAGLLDQLTSEYGEQYPADDAEAAISALEGGGLVDWNEQAELAAKNYLETTSFSRDGLIDQLESDAGDEFTHDQAVHGVDAVYN